MSPHITIIPASTQAGRETIRALLTSGGKPFVRAIYRDPSKAPDEFIQQPNFEAVKGDVATGEGIDFSNSTAVLYVPPPTYDGTDQGEFATKAANHVRDALQRAPSVGKLLIHSAMGSQHSSGIGILRINHMTDQILQDAAPEVRVVRPGYYFEMWADALKTMQADPPSFESPISPADHKVPMLSVQDVGLYCASSLLDEKKWPKLGFVQLFGPQLYSTLDVKTAIEQITGKEGSVVVIKKEELTPYFASHVPKVYAQEFADMIVAMMPGGIIAQDYKDESSSVKGKVEMVDALRQLV